VRSIAVALAVLALGGGGASALDYEPFTGDIYVVSSTGGPRRALTSAPEQEYQPALSPNGRRIAYIRGDGDAAQVWLMNADGSGERQLTRSDGEKARPLWSPNGRRLVFMVWNRSLCEPLVLWCPFTDIWSVNADGSNERKLFGRALQPAWSPDGRRLLFQEFRIYAPHVTGAALDVARADGSHVRRLSGALAEEAQRSPPAWAPGGKQIVFGTTTSRLEHRATIVREDGRGLRRLGSARYPGWASNGKSMALERDSGVWVVPLEGGPARRIGPRADGFGGSCPTWSPGGKRIAFLTSAVLSVVRPDGRGRKALASAALCTLHLFPSPPAWSHDGRRIYFAG
jgi:Tol biopolymer transport system component